MEVVISNSNSAPQSAGDEDTDEANHGTNPMNSWLSEGSDAGEYEQSISRRLDPDQTPLTTASSCVIL